MKTWLKENGHLALAWLWLILAIPAVLWWKESVLFVILLSLYANIEASLSAYHAKKNEKQE